jgi:small conductance mechanosensitive channel
VSRFLTDLGVPSGWADALGVLSILVLIALAALVAILFVRIGAAQVAARLLEREAAHEESGIPQVEMERRIRTLQRIVVRVLGAVIVVIAFLMALDNPFGVNIGPAVAGLGVAGIAVGLGAQALVRDWLAGIFVILENQYNVGDVVAVGGVSGVVEEFSLRRTTLRDLDGVVHSVPNGQITVASNMTRGWARVNLNVEVAYDTDIDKATAVIDAIGQELRDDEAWGPKMLETPSVARIDSLGASGVELKVLGQVMPAQQWAVAGELRKRILAGFAREGIEIPFPHRVVIQRGDGSAESAADAAAGEPGTD